MKNKRFRQSFKNAKNGVLSAFESERNIRIHFVFAVLVILLGVLFKVSRVEFALLIIVIGFVIVAELFNSSIETLADMVVPVYHPVVKKVKDIAAAGVLLSAATAVVVGYFVFWEKVIKLIKSYLILLNSF